MKRFTLEEIANACGGRYVGDASLLRTAVTSVERDSRQIKEGSLFLAIKGEHADGHDYIEQCFSSGAVCALCEKAPENPSKPCIVVGSTLKAVKKIGKAYREKFDIPIVGVSGSVGKTSTKETIFAVLSQKYKTHKTRGNLNNELGVPLTLLSMPDDAEAAVVEMGISDFGEMTRLSEMVQPTVCVLTIIGECHLEKLGNRDGVLKAKTEMFRFARKNAVYILNGDDDKLSRISEVNGKKPVFFGLGKGCDFRAENIKNDGGGKITAALLFDGKKLNVRIPAIGDYMVSNALAAAAVGKSLGLSDNEVVDGIAAYKTVGSRANVIDTGKIKIIDDCYNSNPTSLKASIDTLMNFSGRKVALLGDMKELGKNELELHRRVGEYAKEKGVELVITVGKLAEELARGAGGVSFNSSEQAKRALPRLIKSGDAVLVKASHSMHFEKAVEFLKAEFS